MSSKYIAKKENYFSADKESVAFHDVTPQAPVHFLVIPKKPITTLSDAGAVDKNLLGHLLLVAAKLAQEQNLGNGYRVDLNVINLLNSRSACVRQTKRHFYGSSSLFGDGHSTDGRRTESATQRGIDEVFMDARVQNILERLTGMDLDKIFESTPTLNRSPTQYKFMTEKALQKSMADARLRARRLLQMPPVLAPRKPIDEVLSNDPGLAGLNTVKYLFTDISIGVPLRDRTVVARDPDGTLRRASWEERDRMMLTFFPRQKQKYGTPRVFQDEHMKPAFDDGKYKFVLDRACCQYEPDDPAFIEICHKAYEHVDETSSYDLLHSTRHYGGMMFYLAWRRRIDNVLHHLIQNDRMDEAADVVRLYHLLHPGCKSQLATDDLAESLDVVKVFTRMEATRRDHLELVLQAYEELEKRRRLERRTTDNL